MHEVDYSEMDGTLLETFLAVYENMSISKAAEVLKANQPTVSHRIERMRTLTGDPLFVRSGRGILPTPRATELVPRIREILQKFASIVIPQELHIASLREHFVIAATDFERSLFLLEAVNGMMLRAPECRFDFVWDGWDSTAALRNGAHDLALSPITVEDEPGIHAMPLIEDRAKCYFDSSFREAPTTLDRYLDARHLRIYFSSSGYSVTEKALHALGKKRKIVVELPSFNEVPYLIRGTDLVVTLPGRVGDRVMEGFSSCPIPFYMPPLIFSLIWHERTHNSPAHFWVRQEIINAARMLK